MHDIDRFAGQAYVSLIPFLIAESRPARVPPALAARFLETNLRIYVRAGDGESGIYFFSRETPGSKSRGRLRAGDFNFVLSSSARSADDAPPKIQACWIRGPA